MQNITELVQYTAIHSPIQQLLMFVQLLSLQNYVSKDLAFVKRILKKINSMESDIDEDTGKL